MEAEGWLARSRKGGLASAMELATLSLSLTHNKADTKNIHSFIHLMLIENLLNARHSSRDRNAMLPKRDEVSTLMEFAF